MLKDLFNIHKTTPLPTDNLQVLKMKVKSTIKYSNVRSRGKNMPLPGVGPYKMPLPGVGPYNMPLPGVGPYKMPLPGVGPYEMPLPGVGPY
jgi:hypothetical protein